MEMSREMIKDFLQERRVGILGINRKDSSPQLVPIWYLYDGEVIWMTSGKVASKVVNIKNDPQVTFCVDDRTPPYQGVVVYGAAEIVEENVQEMRLAIARRYLGGALGEAYVAQPRPRGAVLLKLNPERFYSWDYGFGDQG